MKFYSYKGNSQLGSEPCGTTDRSIDHLKTVKGVINRCKNRGWKSFKIYSFTNFYDDKTFKLVHSQ